MLAHACEKKRRWLSRDEKAYKMAFLVFRKFYDVNFRSMKPRTYEDFMVSSHFTAFVKFGKYLLDIQAINPEAFVDFLLKAEVPMKNWTVGFVYEQYIRELNKRESAESAVSRNILLMQQWEMESGLPWNEFFKHVSPNLATAYIRSGRLSPWVLYTAGTSHELMERFSEEQLKMIEQYVDPRFWQRKFSEHKDEVDFIKEILNEAGI
jgi:hypothetical protein